MTHSEATRPADFSSLTCDALVVGAGPVGLTMALELTRLGLSCRIVDKAAAPTDKSKALVVWGRTLELLEELGMVTHTHLGHGAPTYHLAAEADHVHLVCRGCGEVIEVRPELAEGLVSGLDAELGFAADVHHLTVFGRCRECR